MFCTMVLTQSVEITTVSVFSGNIVLMRAAQWKPLVQ